MAMVAMAIATVEVMGTVTVEDMGTVTVEDMDTPTARPTARPTAIAMLEATAIAMQVPTATATLDRTVIVTQAVPVPVLALVAMATAMAGNPAMAMAPLQLFVPALRAWQPPCPRVLPLASTQQLLLMFRASHGSCCGPATCWACKSRAASHREKASWTPRRC